MKQDTIASKVGRPPKFKTPEELAEKAAAEKAAAEKAERIINGNE